MTFRRSDSAYASYHLFYGVDFVAFCEGGAPQELFSNPEDFTEDGTTLDVKYWSVRLEHALGAARTKVISVGGKPQLQSLHSLVVRESFKNILICMDTDYDLLRSRTVNDSFVFYTWGYSWENDVFNVAVLRLLAELFSEQAEDLTNLERECLTLLSTGLKYCQLDLALIGIGREGLFGRNSVGGNLCRNTQTWTWNTAAFDARLANQGYRRGPRSSVRIPPESVQRWMFGKILPHIAKRMLEQHTRNGRAFEGISANNLCYLAIDKFGSLLREGHAEITPMYA
jgi:hypothetical protein